MIRTRISVNIGNRKYSLGTQIPNLEERLEQKLFKAHQIFYRKTLLQIYMDIYGMSKDRALIKSKLEAWKRFK